MGIEILWIIPVIALALFVPFVILSTQRGQDEDRRSGPDDPLEREVESFNRASFTHATSPARKHEKRLADIEKTISSVSAALSDQQKVIEGFRGQDAGVNATLEALKEKLRELQREYDIVISENYALRARVKHLIEGNPSSIENAPSLPQYDPEHSSAEETTTKSGSQPAKKKDSLDIDLEKDKMHLYEDTRMFRPSDLEDTSEIDLSALK